jgi:hypothetical protein
MIFNMCKSWDSIGICIGIKSGKSNPDRHKNDADPQKKTNELIDLIYIFSVCYRLIIVKIRRTKLNKLVSEVFF